LDKDTAFSGVFREKKTRRTFRLGKHGDSEWHLEGLSGYRMGKQMVAENA
jgi:hypothetical protein